MPNKISDYSIIDILNAANIETMRTGNSTVCRCPICHSGYELKRDGNQEAQRNDNNEITTLFCSSSSFSFMRKYCRKL